MVTVSALGAMVALVVAIGLILKKVPPVYGMMAGALAGGLVGGADLVQTVTLMVTGALGITNAVLRILAAGVLAGVLIESGAANTIAETIVRKVGEKRALLALAGAAMIHAGAVVLDQMPHGSFFHATGGSVNMQVHERLKLLPYETMVGLVIAIVSTLIFGVFGFGG
ncbi:hypothetical protein CKG00_14665 (plasmid) [Morganella morganii]|uniref:Uncharacterized protein n=1 Tax=Morganella morganii TaxID=582 RepID=A0A433ZQN3_MORMO|nr:hypothetical protein [Morganella morganii]RUT64435.1 hypothetical protein CKG00_14665 [Morganella morganii]